MQLRFVVATILAVAGALSGCSERSPRRPAMPATGPSTARAPATRSVGTAPATAPATRPQAEGPVSTFSSRPPYPVSLHVRSPDEKQPGWLRILELDRDKAPAAAHGIFPEANDIRVETQNVRRIRVHAGYLPLVESKRTRLLIDGQGIELVSKRRHVTLERRSTGQWVVLPGDAP